MWKVLKYLFLSLILAVFLGTVAVFGGLYYLVVVEPGPEVEAEYIEGLLGRESPVFYRDGENKLGVLFENVHRRYLSYDIIPRHFVNAIVAAEDDKFFSHFGVDIPGIVRAMIVNIKAGRVVQGGSTITQQTAKNLFKRESRSYRAKLKELLYALRLEYKYSKEKILEFYTNQFFVSGNGHGLGVASHYYFSKEPYELNLVECAYIAGSVKRPNYYNPFTKRNQADPVAAGKKVEKRVGYVLGRMLKNNMITRQEYEQAKSEKVVFSRGKMTYRLNTAMDMVKEELESEQIEKALEDNGIYNVATSGIRVYTSIDRDVQRNTLAALRRGLSTLDVRLRGYDAKEVQEQYAGITYSGDTEYIPGAFVFGQIEEVLEGGDQGFTLMSLLDDGKTWVKLNEAGLSRLVTALAKYRKNRWSEPERKDLLYLKRQLQVGDRVYVSLREQLEDGTFSAELERYPKVEGGVIALRQGAVMAMAGGVTDRFFNRAVDAKRLMGSTFKPFLFGAALQLGWSPVDMLDNRRDVFTFMDKPYFPRPDHKSSNDFVSMSWAGVESENVAAVWLLYHLTDHLTPPRLREVAAKMDMAPRVDGDVMEGYQAFKQRIRDSFGIVVTKNVLRKAAFDLAKKQLRSDFLFDNRLEEYEQLKKLHYGFHFDQYKEEILLDIDDDTLSSRHKKELVLRRNLLEGSYLSLAETEAACLGVRSYIEAAIQARNSQFSWSMPAAPAFPEGRMVLDADDKVVFTLQSELHEGWRLWPWEQVMSYILTLNSAQYDMFWRKLQLEGTVTFEAYTQLKQQLEKEEEKLFSLRPYSLEVLGHVRDYRIMLGLQYLIRLGRHCGISSPLEPVLSFPLGSNVVSLVEGVRMYETLVTGKLWLTQGVGSQKPEFSGGVADTGDNITIIDKIEAADGEEIYRRGKVFREVFDARTTAAVGSILQNTVSFGTGRYARDKVRLSSSDEQRAKELSDLNLPLPLLGKTGTANMYRNASFIGFVPVPAEDDETVMDTDGGFALGVYTGYDTNEPMIKGTTRVSGALGALPIWSDTAGILLKTENVGDQLDLVDLAFNGLQLRYPAVNQGFLPVDPDKGGIPLANVGVQRQRLSTRGASCLVFGNLVGDGHFEPERRFHPFWENSSGARPEGE